MTRRTRLLLGSTAMVVALVVAACSGSAVPDASTTTPRDLGETASTTTRPPSVTSTTTAAAVRSVVGDGRFEEPERLVVLGVLPLAPSVTDVWGYVDSDGREFAIVGSRVVDTARGSVYVIDVTDPMLPVVAAEIVGVPAFDVKTWDHYVYASDDGAEAGVVIDIADPYAPVVVGAVPPAHNLFLDDVGHMFIARIEGRPVYSVSDDPTTPVPTDVTLPGHHDSLAIGDRLYLFGGADRTYVYDISDRGSPRLLSSIEDLAIAYHHSGWPTEDGRHLFIADETAVGDGPDITVWDLIEPTNPVLVGTYRDPGAAAHNIQVVGTHAFLSYYGAGIVVLDVSDPTAPRKIAEHDPIPGKIEGWARSDYGTLGIYAGSPSGVIYASGSEGLTLLRFTPPRLPRPTLR